MLVHAVDYDATHLWISGLSGYAALLGERGRCPRWLVRRACAPTSHPTPSSLAGPLTSQISARCVARAHLRAPSACADQFDEGVA